MPAKTDTGLHISMRLLLGIVAGLLISDMLKAAVKTVHASDYVCSPATFQNLFTVLGAILFLIRIVVDNVLYYNDPDARTTRPAYAARISLIFIDLASYAICYHIVAVIEPVAGKAAFQNSVVRMVVLDMAFVELLHLLWCLVAIGCLPVTAIEQTERVPLLKRWAFLSGLFFVLSGVVWLTLTYACPALPAPWAGAIVLTLSLASAVTYMLVMREHQYLGPTTAWKATQ